MATRAERASSFGAIAADYDRLRPPPAPSAVDWLLAGAGEMRSVVDLGAGTGLLSRDLAARGAAVTAVEPDERMRAVLRQRSPGITVLAGRGEAIPLPDASVDGVFVSSAWHWMDPELAGAEVSRVLRDGGRFGAIWTSASRQAGWLAELMDLRGDRGTGDGGPSAREVVLPGSGAFGPGETASFDYTRSMAARDVADMLATYSRVLTATPAERTAVVTRARASLAGQFPGAGPVAVPVRSRCWRAGRLPRSG